MPPSLNNGICTIIVREVPKNCGASASRGHWRLHGAVRTCVRGRAAAAGRATARARVEREEHAAKRAALGAHCVANPPGLPSRQTSRGHRWSTECPAAAHNGRNTTPPSKLHEPHAHVGACTAAGREGHKGMRSASSRRGVAERRPGPTGSRAGAATWSLPLDTSGRRLCDRRTRARGPGDECAHAAVTQSARAPTTHIHNTTLHTPAPTIGTPKTSATPGHIAP